jgi:RimJ/RimL family protein N-acetyltransferase
MVIAGEPYGAGLVGFKGYPNNQGEVEIGYGIDGNFQNRGYTTEAVRALIVWAFARDNCRAVVAETHPANIASQRVLEKAGMRISQKTKKALSWRIDKASS